MSAIMSKMIGRILGPPLRDERGMVTLFIAGAMLLLLGFASLAVDMSYFYSVKNLLQITADSAALASAHRLPDADAARGTARDYALKNMPADRHGTVLTDTDILIGKWDTAARTFVSGASPFNAVRVTARRAIANANAVPSFFSGVFGLRNIDMDGRATAAFMPGRAPWDVLIVQDVTASFGDEIADARIADQTLLNCIRDKTSGTSRVGMAIFTGVGANYVALQPISSGYTTLSTKTGQLKVCGNAGMPACSGTHIGAGLDTATDMFLASPSAAGVKKAIILVSDGEPNPETRKPLAITAANRAFTAGISVFTVLFNRENSATATTFLASLKRGDGISMVTPTASQLPTLLGQLCTENAPMSVGLVG